MRTLWILPLILALCACARVSAPVEDTHAAGVTAIQAAEKTAQEAWATKNVDGLVGLYAPDATLIIPNVPVAEGPEAIRAVLTELFKDPAASVQTSASITEASGDLGYQRGTYDLVVTDPATSKLVNEKGSYVMVYQRQADGAWKVVADINAPESPAAPVQ